MSGRSIKIRTGTVLIGKWNRHKYRVLSFLGSGSNGSVYLVDKGGKKYALKFGLYHVHFFSELNGLKKCMQAQGDFLGPSLYDIDDWDIKGCIYPFYVMEYIEGETFPGKRLSIDELLSQLLPALHSVHQVGYCVGDLTPSNMLVESRSGRLRLIDYGGLTPFGQSIKEYTPWFDRGEWGAGERKASVQYDLFSVVMIVIFCATGKRHLKCSSRSMQSLYDIIQSDVRLGTLSPFLIKGIRGEYNSALRMLRDWKRYANHRNALNPHKQELGWIEALFLISLFSCGFMVWLNVY